MNHPGSAGRVRPSRPGLTALCNRIDALNEGVGWLLGPVIVFVSLAIVYEVISRGVFSMATLWVNEGTVYASAAVYLLAGGYAALHRRHVRIDAIFGFLSEDAKRRLDLLALPFLIGYALTLVVIGGDMALSSLMQRETTGTPWSPPVWPLKACIPLAGVLLLLQTFSNTMRDIGIIEPRASERDAQGGAL
jgi:TRAP-type mannitol/chloroaromatic compound transport system permease small subunit